MREAVDIALHALAIWWGDKAEAPPDWAQIDATLVQTERLPAKILALVAQLREGQPVLDAAQASTLLTQGDGVFSQAASMLGSV